MPGFVKIKTMIFELLSKLFKKRTLLNFIPKEATQQNAFLTKYPEFDGRRIKIAIIDDGIDVSHEGLQKTSEGLPKIIDCYDFTGSGDVDTSVIREMNSGRILIGLSGRKFNIPLKWINPSGKWHLGLKSLYEPYKYPTSPRTETFAKKLGEIDCIVWNDGTKWLACIGTLRKTLENAKVLTNFRDEHECGKITLNGIKLTYCITIHNGGNLLEVFTANADHGSLVAEVAAASYTPRNFDGEGLAPGAQIYSMNVLDSANNYKLSLPALHKAFSKCLEMKVDIINYSMAYFTTKSDEADLVEAFANLINEMVTKHNILIFKGVGNSGPFFASSLKCDPRIQDVILRIGGILTSDIKKQRYNAQEENYYPPVAYPFSSKGPCIIKEKGLPCGTINHGLEFVAPGGFISRNENQYVHGTSVSSPNAAGAVACLISGLKARDIQYSHLNIKFVLFKTAMLSENQNQFEYGHGIIQIDKAFDYFVKNDIIDCKISESAASLPPSKGICYGQYYEGGKSVLNRVVNLSSFIDIAPGEAAAAAWTLNILGSKTKNYIELSPIDKENSFNIKINLSKLEPGPPNFSRISVWDPKTSSTLFDIPIMIQYLLLVTETRNLHIQRKIELSYENPYYIYFYPNFKNTKKICEIKFSAINNTLKNQSTKLCIEYFDYQSNLINGGKAAKYFILTPKNSTATHSISIENSKIHGICVYQQMGSYYSCINLILEIDFKNDGKKDGEKKFN